MRNKLAKFIFIPLYLLLLSCTVQNTGWDIDEYPPPEVLDYIHPSPKIVAEQAKIAKSCPALNNIPVLKLLSYDSGEFSGFSSATAIRWRGKIVYITNRHNVAQRSSFFLVDIDGNWVEVKVVKMSGNVFNNRQKEDDLTNEVVIDLALLEPLSPKRLDVNPRLLYTGKVYNGTVATMGFPNGDYGWSKSQAFYKKNHLVLYNEKPFYSLPGTSGGGVFDCDTGSVVGLTFGTPGFFVVVNPKTKQFRTIKTVKDLNFGYFVAQYAIHAYQIAKFLEE